MVLREVSFSLVSVADVRFDNEGFSCWRVDFKYNEELTQVFMSANQIGGFFNRLEASRKYLFGSVGVLGKANDSIITGALIARGQDIEPVINVAPDCKFACDRRVRLLMGHQGSRTRTRSSTCPTRRTRSTSRLLLHGTWRSRVVPGEMVRTSSRRPAWLYGCSYQSLCRYAADERSS